MSYGIHWQSSAVSKNGNTYLLSIYESGYSSGIATIPTSDKPFILNTLPSSDDPFGALFATELKCSLNITDLTTPFIDFATEDQFKYFATLEFSNLTSNGLIFQGWLQPDASRAHFSTGYKDVQFSFIDGISFLKDIYYPYSDNINDIQSLKDVLLLCLNTLNYPSGFYLNIACSIFADGMADRTASTDNEPFSQSYIAPRTWLTQQSSTTNVDPYYLSDYMSCYDILTKIMLGWGCRLQQSNGQWHIVNINEMASADMYVTKYDQAGTLISSGHYNVQYDLVPWTLGTTKIHFTNNNQYKISRAGHPQVWFRYNFKYPLTVVNNGFLKNAPSSIPVNWNLTSHLAGTASFNAYTDFNRIELTYVTGSASSYAAARPTSIAQTYQFDDLVITFASKLLLAVTPNIPNCIIRIIVTDGTTTYYYDKSGIWKDVALVSYPDYYQVAQTGNELEITETTVTCKNIPIDGSLSVEFYVQPANTLAQPETQPSIEIGKLTITYTQGYAYRIFSMQNAATYLNRLSVDIEIGGSAEYNPVLYGQLCDYLGHEWSLWYRQGENPTTDSVSSLMQIICENYYYIVSKASLNFDCDMMSLMSSKQGETSLTHFQPFSTIKAQDNPSDPLSANGKVYIPSNMQIDLIADEIQQATLLETSNTALTATTKDLLITV